MLPVKKDIVPSLVNLEKPLFHLHHFNMIFVECFANDLAIIEEVLGVNSDGLILFDFRCYCRNQRTQS
jgi:hypothetical protein